MYERRTWTCVGQQPAGGVESALSLPPVSAVAEAVQLKRRDSTSSSSSSATSSQLPTVETQVAVYEAVALKIPQGLSHLLTNTNNLHIIKL